MIKYFLFFKHVAAIESNNNEVVVIFQQPFSEKCHKIVQINFVKLIQNKSKLDKMKSIKH